MRDNMSHPLDLRHTSLYNIVHARKGYGAAMKKDTIDKLIDRIDHIKEAVSYTHLTLPTN